MKNYQALLDLRDEYEGSIRRRAQEIGAAIQTDLERRLPKTAVGRLLMGDALMNALRERAAEAQANLAREAERTLRAMARERVQAARYLRLAEDQVRELGRYMIGTASENSVCQPKGRP